MSRYRITLKPCEAYFFGDENTFRIGEEKESYFIKSLKVPAATSIIGMLRYVLLEQSGLLKTDRVYTDSERAEMSKLIGANGYCVGENENDLGEIKSISPLFIVDEDEVMYIPAPLNHKSSEKIFTPIKLSEECYETSFGKIRMPLEKEFNPKETVGDWYMNVETGEIVKDMFEEEERVGIDKKNHKDAFFKKSYVRIKDGYSFAFECVIEAELKSTVCYMGREKSAFIMTVEEIERDVVKELEDKFDGSFYYAFSDLVITKDVTYNDFAMIKQGSVRMLTSGYKEGRLMISRNAKHLNVIKSGSVFYAESDTKMFYKDNYGFNRIIKLGGLKK